ELDVLCVPAAVAGLAPDPTCQTVKADAVCLGGSHRDPLHWPDAANLLPCPTAPIHPPLVPFPRGCLRCFWLPRFCLVPTGFRSPSSPYARGSMDSPTLR